MRANKDVLPPEWDDPDLPELTDEMLDMAEIRIGGRVVQHATGVLTKDGMKRVENMRPIPFPVLGRPPVGEEPKEQVSLRLDRDVVSWFRTGGKGWQTRMNAALRKAAGY
jgi:uncharacterized protein (DUF4415 family)